MSRSSPATPSPAKSRQMDSTPTPTLTIVSSNSLNPHSSNSFNISSSSLSMSADALDANATTAHPSPIVVASSSPPALISSSESQATSISSSQASSMTSNQPPAFPDPESQSTSSPSQNGLSGGQRTHDSYPKRQQHQQQIAVAQQLYQRPQLASLAAMQGLPVPMPQPVAPQNESGHFVISVSNLPYVVRWQELKDLVKEIIPNHLIVRSEVFTVDNNNKRSHGVGTITVRGRETALKTVQFLDGYEWHTRTLSAALMSPSVVVPHPSATQPLAPAFAPMVFQQPVIPPLATQGQSPNMQPMQPPQQSRSRMHSTPPMSSNSTGQVGSQMHFAIPPSTAMPVQFFGQYPGEFYHPQAASSSPSLASFSEFPQNYHHHRGHQTVDKRKVFIGNIPFNSEWRDLKEFVQSAGKVARVDIINNTEGQSRGFAIAIFETEEDAQHAIDVFNGVEFEGRILTVRLDRYPETRAPHSAAHQSSALSGEASASSSGLSSPGAKNNGYGHGGYGSGKGSKKDHVNQQSHYNYNAVYDNGIPVSTYWGGPAMSVSPAFQNMQAQFQGLQIMTPAGVGQLPYRYGSTPQMQAQMAQMHLQGQYQMVQPQMMPSTPLVQPVPPPPPPQQHTSQPTPASQPHH
ncbi:hypothetical protein POJ06DRAFT_66247 [Lipomyces tetrasporus]|uniref:RRM domain-containing protein n=1 Tax=Lipomyces tetrasporus TaxID=54092 RepID=A0AAD7R0E7_9ASCO|nr:uncharacterized protein POJ06DRAFT_66247 [Lipomyces tetrasporus]KAJ8103262.1 hypothetical protein POJ06DRAFT_66247 [Lipomyces tetrasporus]